MGKKYYIYALDRRTGNLTAALLCPDSGTAHQAFKAADHNLTGQGGYDCRFFDYDWIDIDSRVKIKYEPCIEPSYWLPNWFNKQSEGLFKESEFDTNDFTIVELQTKKNIFDMKGRYANEIRDDIWFMYYANLELQKLANAVKPAETVESNQPIAVPSVQSVSADDCRYPAMTQALTGVVVPDTIKVEQAYIEDPDGTVPNVNVVNQLTKEDITIAQYEAGLLLKHADEADRWHIISKTKYNWTGWAHIAAQDEAESIAKGNKARTPKQMDNFIETIRRNVEARRKNLGIERE